MDTIQLDRIKLDFRWKENHANAYIWWKHSVTKILSVTNMTSMVIEWIELHSLISACFKYVAIQSQAGMDYLPWASIH